MQTTHKEAHPIELLLLGAWLAVEAAAVVAAGLVALLLTVACWRPAAPAPATPPPPAVHPLIELAESLASLPQRQLMVMAGTRRRLPKRRLAEQLVAMPA